MDKFGDEDVHRTGRARGSRSRPDVVPTGNSAVANLFVGAAAGACCAGLLAPRPVVLAPRPVVLAPRPVVYASDRARAMPALVMIPGENSSNSRMERV